MSQVPKINKAYVLIALNLGFATVEQAFENTELTLESLEQGDSIDLALAVQMVRNLNHYSHIPVWASILGAHLGVTSHGPVGYATLSAATLGKALATFVEWEQIRAEAYTAEIIEQEARFEIVIRDTTGDSMFEAFFLEAFLKAFLVLFGVF